MAPDSLHGKMALVTGAAKRIGRAIALALAEEGANVIVHYRDSAAEADELRRELDDLGVQAWIVQGDFDNPNEGEDLFRRSAEIASPIDILVNNSAVFPRGRLKDITFEDLIASARINAWAPFVLSRAFARQGTPGTIVNSLDTRITGYDWLHMAYMLSKHVLAVMTRMCALEFAPLVRVNAVAPGLILPPPGKDERYLERLVDTVPLKRHGNPEDVARAVVFLLQNDFITGQVIYVDGGRHLKGGMDGPDLD